MYIFLRDTNTFVLVSVSNRMSMKRNLLNGIPHGSVIGPLLVTMYIPPLGDVFNFYTYPDDVQL